MVGREVIVRVSSPTTGLDAMHHIYLARPDARIHKVIDASQQCGNVIYETPIIERTPYPISGGAQELP